MERLQTSGVFGVWGASCRNLDPLPGCWTH